MGRKSIQIGGVLSVENNNQTCFRWCKLAKSVNQAKVFRAHAVPQGHGGNLINALKLLANKQEDGDGLIQNIVTNLREESRKGLTEGLREFIQIDNHRALEVGHLREGMGKFLKYESREEKQDTQRCLSAKAPMN